MQRLITKICLFKKGLEEFEDEVNTFLRDGWEVVTVDVQKYGLRTICCALVSKNMSLHAATLPSPSSTSRPPLTQPPIGSSPPAGEETIGPYRKHLG